MSDTNIETRRVEGGILLAGIDMPGRSMNVFSLALMDSLEALVASVEADPEVAAVVLHSGKSAFLAGADLSMIRMFTERAQCDSHAQLVALCGRLGRIFRRLERCRKPFVAAVDGLALGGGLELCLACHARVVSERKGLLLGLPEIRLGLLPGAGGTQRLPRMIGARRGLEMLLQGEPVGATEALELGLVDAVVPSEQLLAAAIERARGLAGGLGPKAWDAPAPAFNDGGLALALPGASARVMHALAIPERTQASYPAYRAIVDCVTEGWAAGFDAALANEMDIFVRLIQDPVAGNMVRSLFLDRQRSLKPLAGATRPAGVAVAGSGARELEPVLLQGRAQIVPAAQLDGQGILLALPGAGPNASGVRVEWLGDAFLDTGPGSITAGAGVWVGSKTEYGRAVEIVLADEDPRAAAAARSVAAILRADALLESPGGTSVLAELTALRLKALQMRCEEDQQTLALALRASSLWHAGRVRDAGVFDAACVVAGLVPACSGGPLNYLRWKGYQAIEDARLRAFPGAPALFPPMPWLGRCCEALRDAA